MVERRLGWEETRQARGVVVARAEVAVVMAEVALHVRMERDGSTSSLLQVTAERLLLDGSSAWRTVAGKHSENGLLSATVCPIPPCPLALAPPAVH